MKLVFSKIGEQPETIAYDVTSIRQAAGIARRRLARYGTPERDHNAPGGTIALWGIRGTDRYGVHLTEPRPVTEDED